MFFNQWVKPRLETALQRPVSVGSLNFSPTGRLVIEDLSAGGKSSDEPHLLRLKRLECRFRPLGLFKREIEVTRFHIDSAEIYVDVASETKAKSEARQSEKRDAKTGSSSPWKIIVSDFALTDIDLTLDLPKDAAAGASQIQVQDFSLACPKFTQDDTWDLKGAGRTLVLEDPESARGLQGNMALDLTYAPSNGGGGTITGHVAASDLHGSIAGQDFQNLGVRFEPELRVSADGSTVERARRKPARPELSFTLWTNAS